MSKYTFLLLSLLCLSALYLVSMPAFETQDSLSLEPVFPNLKDSLNQVQRIEIFEKESLSKIELRQGPLGWRLANKHEYPADQHKVTALLQSISRAKYQSEKTALAKHYPRLGVQAKGGEATYKIKLSDKKDHIIADAYIGYPSFSSEEGTYFRLANGKQSWLIDQGIALSGNIHDWLDRNLISVERDMIKSIHIEPMHGKGFSLIRDTNQEDAFLINDKKDNEKEKTPGAHNLLASALILLQLEDVLPRSDVKMPQDKSYKVHFGLEDGSEIIATLFEMNEKYYGTFETNISSNNTIPPVKTKIDLKNWVFELPSYKALMMMKQRADFLY